MHIIQSRRDFFTTLSATGAASIFGTRRSLADERPPETTKILLGYDDEHLRRPSVHCEGPAAGGRVHRHPLRARPSTSSRFASGEVDFDLEFAAWFVSSWRPATRSPRWPVCIVGCYELFAHEPIRTISDLNGKSVGIQRLGRPRTCAVAHGGACRAEPAHDINWITNPDFNFKELFAEGKVDAFLGAPPKSQELRARKIGRMILNTTTDRPWSQYFCCFCSGTGSSSAIIRSPPSAFSEPSSRPPTSVPPSRRGPHNGSSMAALRIATNMRSRR